MDTKLSEVKFSDLHNYNDANSIVFTAVLLSETDMDSLEEWLKEIGLIHQDQSIKKVHFITGNVRGDARNGADSRADWLIEFDRSDLKMNPIARLNCPDLKWTSDFITNFKKDYN